MGSSAFITTRPARNESFDRSSQSEKAGVVVQVASACSQPGWKLLHVAPLCKKNVPGSSSAGNVSDLFPATTS